MKTKKPLLLALALVFCLWGCTAPAGVDSGGGGSDEGIDPNKAITLNIQSAAPLKYNYKSILMDTDPNDQIYKQAKFTEELVNGFKELYPNVKLNFIEDGWGDALHEKNTLYISDWLGGGRMAVDIMIGETYMGFYAENGVFEELDAAKFGDIVEGSYADMYIDGKIYGVPMCTGILGLQYNDTILAEAGIAQEDRVPATWGDLLANVQTVDAYAKANGKGYSGIILNAVAGMSGAFRALPFMRQAGGDFTDENGNVALNSAANAAAFGFLRSLAQYVPANSLNETNEDALQSMFLLNNKAGYFVDGQWAMLGAGANFKSAALPKVDAQDTKVGNAFIGNVLFGVTKGSHNKAAARAFLEYLTSAQVQLNLFKKDGRLPVNKTTLASSEIREVNPGMNTYIDMLLAGGFGGGLPCFTSNATNIWTRWGVFYRDVMTTQNDIASLAASLQNDINGFLQ